MTDSTPAAPTSVHALSTEEELRRVYARPAGPVLEKVFPHLDRHSRRFIELSPFFCIGSSRPDGLGDVSPRGGEPGFVHALDDTHIAFPDRPGNNRLDTLKNLLENPEIALIFLIPGIADTVRVAGTARLSVDPELLASMAVQGKEPKCAIVISVRQAYLHCAKALLRSKLWQPDYVQPRGTFPSISRMVGDQIGLSEEDKKTGEARTERAYKDGLWAPIQ